MQCFPPNLEQNPTEVLVSQWTRSLLRVVRLVCQRPTVRGDDRISRLLIEREFGSHCPLQQLKVIGR